MDARIGSAKARLAAAGLLAATAVVFVLLTSQVAHAMLERLSVEQMSKLAERIVIARTEATKAYVVTSADASAKSKGRIQTDVTLRVVRTIKGKTAATVKTTLPGGTVGSRRMVVTDVPQFERGDTALIFLDDQNRVIGWSQGKLDIKGKYIPALGQSVERVEGRIAKALGKSARKSSMLEVASPGVVVSSAPRLMQLDPLSGSGGLRASVVPASPVVNAEETIFSDDFESGMGDWTVWYQGLGSSATWGTTTHRQYAGSYSAYCAQTQVPAPGPYPNQMQGWMTAGPFDLSTASSASLGFQLWLNSEFEYDYFYVGASTDGVNFSVATATGNSGGWVPSSLDLSDYTGQSQVWIVFIFESDDSIQREGAYVDDVTLVAESGGSAPANDNFASAQTLSGNSGSVSGTNVGATKEEGEPNHAGSAGGASVWYQWTAAADGALRVDTEGSSFDTLLGVYTGSAVDALTVVASNDDIAPPGNRQSRATFTVSAGTTYRIAVDGYNGSTGSITLNWQFTDASLLPQITNVSPDTAPAGCGSPDSRVTIAGSRFGATQDGSTVQFYYKRTTPIEADIVSWSDTQIVCEVPTKLVDNYAASASTGPVKIVNPSGWPGNGAPFTVTFGYGRSSRPSPNCTYRVNANTADMVGEEALVDAGVAAWNPHSIFQFIDGGACTTTNFYEDGNNDIFWSSSLLPPGVVAASVRYYPAFGGPGAADENDVCFNDYYAWGDGSADNRDVQSIASHEVGHWLVLLDLYSFSDSGKVMHGYSSAGEVKRTLHAADIAGIQWIYGTSGPTGSMSINNGASHTTSTSVTLNSSITGASQMRFRNAGGAWSDWEDYAATKAWTLTTGDGPKTVEAEYRDGAGQVLALSDDILLETAPGLVSYWPAEGNAQDVAGSNDGVMYNGATFAPGVAGQAFSFDGEDDRITVSDAESLKLTRSLTISAWIMARSGPWAGNILFRGDDRSCLDPYLMCASGDGRVAFHVESETGTIERVEAVIPTDSFVHVAGTLDDATGQMSLFVNGEPVMQTTTSVRPFGELDPGANPSVGIGAHGGYPGTPHVFPFGGLIDELRLYSRALSATEIRDLYTAQAPPTGTMTINGDAVYATSTAVILDSSVTGATEMRFRNAGGAWSDWESYAATKAWTLTTGDGPKTVEAEYRNAALTVMATSDTITLDTTAPTGSVVINSGAIYTTTTAVTLSLSASDLHGVAEMRISNDGSFDSPAEDWQSYAATKSWTLSAGDGTKTVYVQYNDNAGNTSGSVTDTIILDTTAPSGAMSINSGVAYTTSTSVTLNSSVTGAAEMRFRNAGGAWSDWEAYASTKAWTLTSGDGVKTVEAEYKDEAGNTISRADDIMLDTIAPTGWVSINSGATHTNTTAVTLTLFASDLYGVSQMRISNDGDFDTELWESFAATKVWALTDGDGTKTVYVQYKDYAGNASGSFTDTIILDTTAPSGTFAINGGASHTASTSVTLNSSITGASQMRFRNAGGAWSDWESYAATKAWTLTTGDGPKTVEAEYRDEAGNTLSRSDDITLDTSAPSGTMVINGDAAYATSTAVTLNSSVTGAAEMRFRNAGGAWSDWESYAATKAWTLTTGDGPKTVEAEYRNAALTVMATSDTITLDATAPTGSVVINSGAIYTTTTAVTLSLSASDLHGVAEMRISNDGTFDSPAEDWQSYAATKSWTLSAGDGTKTVYAQYKDTLGNGSGNVTDTIILDTTPPTVPGNVSATPGNRTAYVTWSASTDALSGMDYYRVYRATDAGGPYTSINTTTSLSYNDSGLTNGTTYWYKVSAVDNLGNEGAQSVAASATPNIAATSLSLEPTMSTTAYDETPTLSGYLQQGTVPPTPIQTGSVRVYIERRASGGGWDVISPGLSTNADGFFSWAVSPCPTENATYRATFGGEGEYFSATSPEVTVNVAAKVTLNVSRTLMISGRTYGIWARYYRAYRAYYLRYRRAYLSYYRAYRRTRSARYRYLMYRYRYYMYRYYRLYARYLYILRHYSSYRTCTMSGDITPARNGKVLTIMYKYGDEWRTLIDTTTSAGTYSETWAPYYPGTFYVRTHFPADAQNAEGNSDTHMIVVR